MPSADRPTDDRPEPAPAPILASEVLRADLVPKEPTKLLARIWCGSTGALFLLAAIVDRAFLPVLPPGSVPLTVGLGALGLAAASFPAAYLYRATATWILGLVVLLLGLLHAGPAQDMTLPGRGMALFQASAAIFLPAALLFRDRYRIFPEARKLLAGAYVLSLPLAVALIWPMVAHGELGVVEGSWLVVVLAMLAGLGGFLGGETTGGGASSAAAILAATALSCAIQTAVYFPGQWPRAVLAGLSFAAAAGATAIGLYEVMAHRFAAHAEGRYRELARQAPSAPPSSMQGSDDARLSGDWSTHFDDDQ